MYSSIERGLRMCQAFAVAIWNTNGSSRKLPKKTHGTRRPRAALPVIISSKREAWIPLAWAEASTSSRSSGGILCQISLMESLLSISDAMQLVENIAAIGL